MRGRGYKASWKNAGLALAFLTLSSHAQHPQDLPEFEEFPDFVEGEALPAKPAPPSQPSPTKAAPAPSMSPPAAPAPAPAPAKPKPQPSRRAVAPSPAPAPAPAPPPTPEPSPAPSEEPPDLVASPEESEPSPPPPPPEVDPDAEFARPPPPATTKLPVVTVRARTPIKFTETAHEGWPQPGKSWIRLDPKASENDLDLRIWKLDGVYNLELSFPLPSKDSLLAVDSYGRLKPEEKKRLDQPYIRFTMPDGKVRMISFGCAKGLCRALWPRFPFDETRKLALVKVEVNLRGLAGHTWTFRYNQIRPETGVVKLERESVRLDKTNAFVATNLYRKGLYTPPGSKVPREPTTIDEWIFSKEEKLQSTAYHRVGVPTLYEIHDGDFVVDVSIDGVSLESFEVHKRDRLWIEPGTILTLKAPKGGRVHRLEF